MVVSPCVVPSEAFRGYKIKRSLFQIKLNCFSDLSLTSEGWLKFLIFNDVVVEYVVPVNAKFEVGFIGFLRHLLPGHVHLN